MILRKASASTTKKELFDELKKEFEDMGMWELIDHDNLKSVVKKIYNGEANGIEVSSDENSNGMNFSLGDILENFEEFDGNPDVNMTFKLAELKIIKYALENVKLNKMAKAVNSECDVIPIPKTLVKMAMDKIIHDVENAAIKAETKEINKFFKGRSVKLEAVKVDE